MYPSTSLLLALSTPHALTHVPGVSGSAEGVDDDEGEDELHAELAAGPPRSAGSLWVGVHPDDGVVGLALDAEDEGGARDAAAALREHVHDAAQGGHEAREEQAYRHGGVRVASGHLKRVQKVTG